MKIDYLTLFPEMFDGVLNHSILKRAQDKDIINVNTINFRDYSVNKHNQVDDYPFGGGQGMVLKPEPVFNAMEDINRTDDTRVILMCPQGRPFTQDIAQELSEAKHIVFICGHYEGYDRMIRSSRMILVFSAVADLIPECIVHYTIICQNPVTLQRNDTLTSLS